MRLLLATFVLVCGGVLVTADVNLAQGKKAKKEVVLKGKIACNKCELNKSTECETVIVVKDKKTKKDIIYFFDAASHKKHHDGICAAAKNGTVSGFVRTEKKKLIISVKKLTFE